MQKKAIKYVTKTPITVFFPNVMTPRPDTAEIDPGKFTCMVMFPKGSPMIKEMQAAVEEAIQLKWPGKKPGGLNLPIKDGDTKVDPVTGKVKETYAGKMFINAKTGQSYPPQVVDARNQPILSAEEVDGYTWFTGRVSVNFSGYDTAGNKGVGVYLNQVQFLEGGDLRGGGSDFEAFESDDEVVDDFM